MNLNNLLNIFKPKVDNSHIKILVIDDSELDQKVACAAVTHGGYQVLKASDGKTGLDMVFAHHPDLILLDYNLPDSKGPEICQVIKKNKDTEHIPVLFLTSMDTPDSVLKCYEEGGENYLAKPISPKFLLKQIELALKDRKEKN